MQDTSATLDEAIHSVHQFSVALFIFPLVQLVMTLKISMTSLGGLWSVPCTPPNVLYYCTHLA
jgi:hypothetical protein